MRTLTQVGKYLTVFISSGYYNKSTQIGWPKQKVCISLSSAVWEIQGQGAADSRFGESPLPDL